MYLALSLAPSSRPRFHAKRHFLDRERPRARHVHVAREILHCLRARVCRVPCAREYRAENSALVPAAYGLFASGCARAAGFFLRGDTAALT